MSKTFDVIVLGLGAHGSSALYHLSKKSLRILGIDRYKPPHAYGSSHGQSRIIRQAYHENPLYVPFLKAAYTLWYDIEKTTGRKLLLRTGGLILGSEDSRIINGAKLSADTYDIAYDYLDQARIRKRFPAFQPPMGTVGVLERDAGILFPELCIQTHLEAAEENGALLQYDEPVTAIVPNNDVIEVVSAKSTYYTSRLIVSAGAWLNELIPDLHLPLTIERQVLYWLRNRNEQLQENLTPDRMPVFLWEYMPAKIFYGFPDLGDGIKIAFHHAGDPVKPGMPAPPVSGGEINGIMSVAREYLDMEAAFNDSVTCMYTNTPDENFIIDFHPQHRNIIIASPCSGHGFKFASVAGKILCDMALDNSISFDMSPFRISRFGA